MLNENFLIMDRNKSDNFFPVLTLIAGQFKHRAISAWLSFLSICHIDFCNNVRLQNIISTEEQGACLDILDNAVNAYVNMTQLSVEVQDVIIEQTFKIIKNLSGQSVHFLKSRVLKICGTDTLDQYWSMYENVSCVEDVKNNMHGLSSALQFKYSIDFSLFLIAMVLFYGGEGDFYNNIVLLENNLKLKYGNTVPYDKMGLCLWTMDMSFVQKQYDSSDCHNEHCALLNAVRSINQEMQVVACIDSRLWMRDIIAWVDDDYSSFVKSISYGDSTNFGCGLLSEGGNIVTGEAVNKFLLVAQEPLSQVSDEVDFYFEMESRCIRTYTLPDGFLWARNPQTHQVLLLDSVHIDTVINVIPALCTTDERLKIIIDPVYYELIKEDSEFARFLKEQKIIDADIVIIDERELYLNLSNFSVLHDQKGEKKLLFNKDCGYTLPRLHIKDGFLVQPEIEITNISSFFGTIRCATNMLPQSLVKNLKTLNVTIPEEIPNEIKTVLLNQCRMYESQLFPLYVLGVFIKIGYSDNTYEFDDIMRMLYINLLPDQIADADICSDVVKRSLLSFAEEQRHNFGIKV